MHTAYYNQKSIYALHLYTYIINWLAEHCEHSTSAAYKQYL